MARAGCAPLIYDAKKSFNLVASDLPLRLMGKNWELRYCSRALLVKHFVLKRGVRKGAERRGVCEA